VRSAALPTGSAVPTTRRLPFKGVIHAVGRAGRSDEEAKLERPYSRVRLRARAAGTRFVSGGLRGIFGVPPDVCARLPGAVRNSALVRSGCACATNRSSTPS